MTESARQALVGLRDFSTLQWYVVPLLALLFYIYVVEIRDARRTGNKSIDEDRTATVWGIPNRWFWALFYSAVSVLVELALNQGGLLVWDYRWWNRGLIEVLPIFVFGYLWFYLAAKFAIERTSLRAKVRVPATLFTVAALLNVIGLGLFGWTY
jgi:hypothetical protein